MKQFSFVILFSLLATCVVAQKASTTKPVVIGYVGGYRGLADTSIIEANKLTHINYAFVDVKNNRAYLHNERTDTINFRNLNGLKLKNPSLKILISIGGWTWSKNFSDAVLSDTSRKAFAESAVAIMAKYDLDGVDIDWEYPGLRGDSNVFRPEDKENYTLMFKALRAELDTLQQTTGKKYLLTTAVGGFLNFLHHTEMGKAQQYLDYVNLMTYDYGWRTASHHTNLYSASKDSMANSADKAVAAFVSAGVPVSKLVMGIAFYGRGLIVEGDTKRGIDSKITSHTHVGGYSYIKDSLLTQKDYRSYWDKKAKAPYIFNATDKKFISYDDERSVKYKCKYVLRHKLAGVMFWEYADDRKGYLLAEITSTFGN
ncbi:glycoside hydrolase family 18 protein [Pinibacter soli]|uniref:chitinase n=1 Tax=Pinibacter soli TaxID=3044211 RepID=A0ABT6RDS4_9BACT|nr:glycoside hydrolase family 18 protein [Pinibacter soli]MDI3320711.1 glycoside hydrolase family 18 protein [Pinibacter soli]